MAIRLVLTVLLGCMVVVGITGERPGSSESVCASTLGERIDAIMALPDYRKATWGISVEGRLERMGDVVSYYAHEPHDLRVPASNTKLLTTSALFSYYDGDITTRTFETTLHESLNSSGGNVLCVAASGDPSLTYDQLNDAVTNLSLPSAIDSVLLDDTVFYRSFYADSMPFPSSWQWVDIVSTYGAHPSAFVIDRNSLSITVRADADASAGDVPSVALVNDAYEEAVPIDNSAVVGENTDLDVTYVMGDPAIKVRGSVEPGYEGSFGLAAQNTNRFFSAGLGSILANQGISAPPAVPGQCKHLKAVQSIRSPTWDEMFNLTMKESDNLYAEEWLRVLGTLFPGTASNTASAGLAQVESILESLGVPTDEIRQRDGSGISVQNLVTPNALVSLLWGMRDGPQFELYQSFLPIAGVDGTLEFRFVGTPAEGNVFAKTGTITGVNALSGYVNNDQFETLLFSILVNESDEYASVIRDGIDEIVVLLVDLDPNC